MSIRDRILQFLRRYKDLSGHPRLNVYNWNLVVELVTCDEDLLNERLVRFELRSKPRKIHKIRYWGKDTSAEKQYTGREALIRFDRLSGYAVFPNHPNLLGSFFESLPSP